MNKNLLKFVWSMLTAVFFTISGYGQGVTSAAFNGSVTDTKGEPLVGATVVAKHLPSGSMYATTTRTDGKYNLPNVRIGGPYTVSVTYVGYKTNELNDVYLALGQSFKANFNIISPGFFYNT